MKSGRLRNTRVTPHIASAIKGLWLHSRLNQAQIAARLGELNQGRVSEVLNNKLHPHVEPADLSVVKHLM